MSSSPQKLIFVSTNDKGQGGAASRKTINSHVQRESQRRKKLARTRNLTQSFWTPRGVDNPPKRGRSLSAEHQSSSYDRSKLSPSSSTETPREDRPTNWAPQSLPPPATLIRDNDAGHPIPGVELGRGEDSNDRQDDNSPSPTGLIRTRSWPDRSSPSTVLGIGWLNGFVTRGVPLTNHMKYLLHHLLTITLPEYWTHRSAAERLAPLYLSLSSSQPEALFGHLATAATHLCIQYGQSQDLSESHAVWKRLRAEQIGYKRDAMLLFNKKLASAGAEFDKSIFHVLMSLLVVESMVQDEIGITAHLNGLHKLVSLRGGMDTLPEYLKMGLTTLSYDWAIVTGSMPLLPPEIDEPVVLSEEVSAILSGKRLNLQDLGLGFRKDNIIAILDPRLHGPIHQLRDAMLFREFCAFKEPSLDPAQRRYFMYESMQSRYRTLKLPFLEPYSAGSETLFYRSEACRLALLFSGIIQRYLDSSSIIFKSLTGQLLAALKNSDLSSLWGPATDLLAWILFVGAHLSKGHETERWFHVHLARCGRALGWREWAECTSLLKMFFYTDRLHERSFQDIWADVQKVVD